MQRRPSAGQDSGGSAKGLRQPPIGGPAIEVPLNSSSQRLREDDVPPRYTVARERWTDRTWYDTVQEPTPAPTVWEYVLQSQQQTQGGPSSPSGGGDERAGTAASKQAPPAAARPGEHPPAERIGEDI